MNCLNSVRAWHRGLVTVSMLSLFALGCFLGERFARGAEPVGPSDEIQRLLKKEADLGRNLYRDLDPKKAGQDPSRLTEAELTKLAEYYRGQYPFVSLRERLAYERKLPQVQATPTLTKETEERLLASEKAATGWNGTPRLRALTKLHSSEVSKFISREGFGLSRMIPPTTQSLPIPETKPLSPRQDFALSATHTAGPVVTVPRDEPTNWLGADSGKIPHEQFEATVQERYDAWTAKHNPLLLPTNERLFLMHNGSVSMFAGPYRNGLVRNVDEVSGFAPHAAGFVPFMDLQKPNYYLSAADEEKSATDPTRHWQTRRMNLVSLLKQAEPSVYVSEQLPAMAELAKAKTRPLDTFEAHALKKLKAGEDVVIAAQTNRIAMLGGLRATKNCQECHVVPHGELLGAFSYELVRVKPVPPEQKPSGPQG